MKKMWFMMIVVLVGVMGVLVTTNNFSKNADIYNKLPALLLVGTRTEKTLPELYKSPNKKIRVLIVPGHDESDTGATFRGYREADLNVILAERLVGLFQKNPHFEVFLTRTTAGYTSSFVELFAEHREGIRAFRTYVQHFSRLFKRANIVQEPNNQIKHNTANPENATRLYGINWWANGNNIDLVLHIHFNDYPGRKRNKEGIYSGFAIYYPELQLPNFLASKNLAKDLHVYLKNYFSPSNYKRENDGLVESQNLIAVGSNGSLESATLLIEYAYIYEPQLQDPQKRDTTLTDYALRTYEGIVQHLEKAKTP